MSIRHEQYEALKRSRAYIKSKFNFWVDLRIRLRYVPFASDYTQKKVHEAYRCLRHFPFLHDDGQPMWSQTYLTKDE